jgi:hypothetical protein
MTVPVWIVIAMALGALVHEAGHFACAAVAGIAVKLFSVGLGPVILRGRLGSTDLELRAWPIGGFILPVTYDQIRRPWIILHVLGGPLGNCALIGLVAWLDHVG